MPGRPDENTIRNMIRTESPYEGSGSPRGILPNGRFAFVMFMIVLTGVAALSLGWAALSLNESGAREAQAQSSGSSGGASPESPEIAQSQSSQSNGQGSNGDSRESEQDYAAFGNKENPFEPIVATAESNENGDENGGPDDDANNGTDNGSGNGNGGGGNGANFDNGGLDEPGSDDVNGSDDFDDSFSERDGELTDRGGPADEFERRIREEESQEEDSGFEAQSGRQGTPGSGGSGRSGIGEPADEFRNGGGGVGK